jgi:EpsI family protein
VTRRLWIVTACLVLTGLYLARTTRAEPVAPREPLNACPLQINDWNGRRAADLDEKTLAVLGVDDYINRLYLNGGGALVSLYVGYYGSQRQGDTIHSPLNCLPGAGWLPVRQGRINIGVANGAGKKRDIEVNRLVIEKGVDRQLVLYWYQSHGRVVASEYWGRAYLVLDAVRLSRTDGAFVRVITPAPESDADADAERGAVDFVQSLFPLLDRYLPS